MSNQDPLVMACAAFKQWRHDRSYKNERTPKPLRLQAVALLTHYPSAKITSTLHINTTQLTLWRAMAGEVARSQENVELTKPATEFVPLPLDNNLENTLDDVPSPDALCLELSFVNGHQLRLSGAISASMLSALVQQAKS